MTKTFFINQIEREDDNGHIECLYFKKGVNVITGPSNSGKTMWLQMFDYLLGDSDSPESSFHDLAIKYSKIRAELMIDGKECTIERRWKEYGMKSKVLFNGEQIPVNHFSESFLTQLNIPVLRFPKGDPYSDRTWPELSWRTLYRHIYRRETFWNDVADLQPYTEQHAVIAQFLGLADKFFPPEYGEMVDKRKQLIIIKARKDQYTDILDHIASNLMNVVDGKVFATPEYFAQKITELNTSIGNLNNKRENILERASDNPADLKLTEERLILLQEYDKIEQQKNALLEKKKKISELFIRAQSEEDKLLRGKRAGLILKDIKITHCPACNQAVELHEHDNECPLCHQVHQSYDLDSSGTERIDFEISQLRSEKIEAKEIIQRLISDLPTIDTNGRRLKIRLKQIDEELAPLKKKFGMVYGTELTSIDMERGRLFERIQFYNSINDSIQQKEKISQEIDTLNAEISHLEESLAREKSEDKIEASVEAFENGMATYLSSLSVDSNKWSEERVHFDIAEKSFNFKISGKKWSGKLGARMKCHFLLAYNYALLSLSGQNGYHYPGLTVIDLPPELRDSFVAGDQNYIVTPFQKLCRSNNDVQLIITGHSFENIEGANIIEFTKDQYSPVVG